MTRSARSEGQRLRWAKREPLSDADHLELREIVELQHEVVTRLDQLAAVTGYSRGELLRMPLPPRAPEEANRGPLLVRIVERLGGNLARLECGHAQEVSTFPKSKTICATCQPLAHKEYVERGRWRWATQHKSALPEDKRG